VTDAGTFSDYPADVVRKVRWQADGLPGLIAALGDLTGDPEARAALGRNALKYVRETHAWEQAAAAYVDAIESTFAERPTRPAGRAHLARWREPVRPPGPGSPAESAACPPWIQ